MRFFGCFLWFLLGGGEGFVVFLVLVLGFLIAGEKLFFNYLRI